MKNNYVKTFKEFGLNESSDFEENQKEDQETPESDLENLTDNDLSTEELEASDDPPVDEFEENGNTNKANLS